MINFIDRLHLIHTLHLNFTRPNLSLPHAQWSNPDEFLNESHESTAGNDQNKNKENPYFISTEKW